MNRGVSVSRSIFALVNDRDRAYFGRQGEGEDQVGFIDEKTRAIFGRSYAAEPDALIEQLKKDEAVAEADTLLLTVPNQLGVDYNAHVIEAILTHVAARAWMALTPAAGDLVSGAGHGSRGRNRSRWAPMSPCLLATKSMGANCLRYVVIPMCPGRTKEIWSGRRDSNPRPPTLARSCSTTELHPHPRIGGGLRRQRAELCQMPPSNATAGPSNPSYLPKSTRAAPKPSLKLDCPSFRLEFGDESADLACIMAGPALA